MGNKLASQHPRHQPPFPCMHDVSGALESSMACGHVQQVHANPSSDLQDLPASHDTVQGTRARRPSGCPVLAPLHDLPCDTKLKTTCMHGHSMKGTCLHSPVACHHVERRHPPLTRCCPLLPAAAAAIHGRVRPCVLRLFCTLAAAAYDRVVMALMSDPEVTEDLVSVISAGATSHCSCHSSYLTGASC